MSQLPTGTVTLLFTDIEGSTRLLQQLGEGYASVLRECRDLLRAAFRGQRGHEVDTQGDAFFVAFARATDAVSAAVSAQRALASHTFVEGVAVRVRMGLHTGEPPAGADGYVGLDVHHTARIMSAGHGGQVLLTQTTRELVEHGLPDGVSLRDLGEHRLKDLQRPAHLYQLVIADLPSDFPPLRTLDSRPNNLPVQLTQLIGREQEVATALKFLQREQVRLLTLTGPGGTGKTRLALQVAADLSDAFSNGVYFVNLAPISDPEFVVPTIAQTLELKETGNQPLLDLLKGYLREKQILLLLDNFEQVVDAALHVAELLVACPMLTVLVTSRAALHIRGEQEFAVPPLAVPDFTHVADLVTLSQYEAVALFIARAQAVKPEFQVTNANAEAVAEICIRLDGLPLAIELAAARIKVLPPQALLARLDQRFTLLTSRSQDVPARHQTLRSTIQWSYQLLDADEQRLFRRLAVFAGSCTLEAIEAVCVALDSDAAALAVLDGVASLVDKSLLQHMEQEEGEARLMLETIREYGLEYLATSGEMEVARQAHADFYLALAEEAEPQLGQLLWQERLEREHDNLRAALSCLLGRGEARESIEMALRLGASLWYFWMIRSHQREGWTFLERALARSEGVAASVRAKALCVAANLAGWLGDLDRSETLCQQGLVLFREVGDQAGVGNAVFQLGLIALNRSDLTAARSRFEESLALLREAGDKGNAAWSLRFLAEVDLCQGKYTLGRSHAEVGLLLFRELGDTWGIAYSLDVLARGYLNEGKAAKALPLLEESLALHKEIGDKHVEGLVLGDLGLVAFLQGNAALARSLLEEGLTNFQEEDTRDDLENKALTLSKLAQVVAFEGNASTARALYEQCLAIARRVNNMLNTPLYLEGLARVVAAQGELLWAARLWGAAEALREALGTPLPPVYRADYERSVTATRASLGEKVFAKAWAEGQKMTPEQALATPESAIVLSASPTGGRPSSPPAASTVTYPDGLTTREVEVLRLVAQGFSNAEIAEQLIISLLTVKAHMRSLYNKLGISSRSAATRYAIEHQLV